MENDKLKAALRDEVKCFTCKYGVFGTGAHCTFWGITVETHPNNKCRNWEKIHIDERKRQLYEEFKKVIHKK